MRILTFAVAAAALAVSATAALAQAQLKPVTRADFTNKINGRFSAMDTNHDGSISAAELSAEQQKETQQAKNAVNQQMAARFKQLDTNKDNQLSLQEFLAAVPTIRTAQSAEQMMQQLDSNKDGKLSADEFRSPQLANFNKADANHDGTVTPAELQAAAGKK